MFEGCDGEQNSDLFKLNFNFEGAVKIARIRMRISMVVDSYYLPMVFNKEGLINKDFRQIIPLESNEFRFHFSGFGLPHSMAFPSLSPDQRMFSFATG